MRWKCSQCRKTLGSSFDCETCLTTTIPMSETQREIERFYKDVAMRVLREIEKLTMAGPVSNHYSPEPSCPGPQSDEVDPKNINDIE